ncbi:NAD-dependent epimerase/dehydratase family protein [Agrobacterium vitis]|uniref:NAD-dependent epimerase/dehydratase family protein n=1 Tax=Agrobacterium vitis TaxID=373 RepID=A0ABD6G8H6_AGRVI|nr:NAD-dependent epimerase/dehydratase family protein [Agrobacterium vitis]MUO94316.1 NAD-dependent epimerase/dehydratase family protein [Agrobacterium vitis]MUP03230.1 NAD-dependent epimerase/dehydratase family protein [Agrobacterium vitis]MUZ85376.1 NAD-dependent epimerase/dehydratase family protein [Agrobacterium vitis]MVA91451.1 NAD-dependent epimerase/dehydratase family protein [Agrobacterium vitis]
MRYFITGTAGFIGFHLARRLLQDGHTVTGYDGMTAYYNLKLKEARNAALAQFPSFTGVIGMLEDRAALERAVDQAKPDVIIHLAAQAGVRYSLENPKAYLDSNLIGSWNIVEIARQLQIGHLMLASTSSIYGANPQVPFRETDRADEPMTFYAASKKGMELMAHSYAHLYKVPTTAFRFFTVYGPWGRPDMALFKFMKAMLADEAIEIYGEGKMSRDFTYIDDLIDSVIALSTIAPGEENRVRTPENLDTLSHNAPFRVINIGGGQPIALMDFIETIETIMGRPTKRKMLPMQQGDVPRTFASPDLLVALTGQKPTTTLDVGVKATMDWYLEHYRQLGL